MGFLAGKRLLITGVLNNRSIAYGIAKACHREGAELAFSYQGERFKDRITEFAADFGSKLVFECDVADDAQISALFDQLGAHWDQFDGFVHAIAFAPRDAIAGDFLDGMTRENFRIAHDISAYSFPALARTVTGLGYDLVDVERSTGGLLRVTVRSSACCQLIVPRQSLPKNCRVGFLQNCIRPPCCVDPLPPSHIKCDHAKKMGWKSRPNLPTRASTAPTRALTTVRVAV